MKKPPAVRWIAVGLLMVYGFAKLNGAQFTVLDSELTKPMGQVSGFWLTWYYFGYSPVYGTLIAFMQIGGALLLAWPSTALLGALMLVPVMTNIILIDIFYRVDLDATLAAVVILGCLVAVIAPHLGRLRAAAMLEPARQRSTLRLAALGICLAGACAFTWWVANYNNRLPTSIDGIWSVISQPTPDATHSEWRQVFFERNRAYWVTFRAADGADEQHHFEVDRQGVVRVWQTWLTKGPLIMEGRVLTDGRLELHDASASQRAALILQRQRVANNEPRRHVPENPRGLLRIGPSRRDVLPHQVAGNARKA